MPFCRAWGIVVRRVCFAEEGGDEEVVVRRMVQCMVAPLVDRVPVGMVEVVGNMIVQGYMVLLVPGIVLA